MTASHSSNGQVNPDNNIPIAPGIELRIASRGEERGSYATSSLPKGFIMVDGGQELTEEAVGFGFPVAKRGLETIFPGSVYWVVEKHGAVWEIQATYTLNLVERISRAGSKTMEIMLLYPIKNLLAAFIRSLPLFRGMLTAVSSLMRKIFHWETTYQAADISGQVKLISLVETGKGLLAVDIDTRGLPPEFTEVVIMNEQGAHYFDLYQETGGSLIEDKAIGCWDEVIADRAWFESRTRRIAFGIGQAEGARLYRGRELVGTRLSWAGFGYAFRPSQQKLHYEMKIERLG